jgi:AcrR family transcriptional regulator
MVTRQEARDSQRPRLLAALMRLVAEHGYPEVSVAMVASEARVSLSTFYEHFRDKEHCLLEAYAEVAEQLLTAVTTAAELTKWPGSVRAGVAAYVHWFASHPDAAATFVVAIHTAGPLALRRRQEVLEQFRTLLCDRGSDPLAAAAVVATLDAAVHERLVEGDLVAVLDTIPDLSSLAVAIIGTTVTA